MNAPSKIGTAVWLLSFPYLPMRGLYPDATPNMQNTLGTLRLLEGPRTKTTPPDEVADLSGNIYKNAGTLFRPPIRRDLGTAAAPGLPASICLQDPYSLRVVWEKILMQVARFQL